MWTLFRAPRGQGSRKGGAGREEGVWEEGLGLVSQL